jgi:hypothetical protein
MLSQSRARGLLTLPLELLHQILSEATTSPCLFIIKTKTFSRRSFNLPLLLVCWYLTSICLPIFYQTLLIVHSLEPPNRLTPSHLANLLHVRYFVMRGSWDRIARILVHCTNIQVFDLTLDNGHLDEKHCDSCADICEVLQNGSAGRHVKQFILRLRMSSFNFQKWGISLSYLEKSLRSGVWRDIVRNLTTLT